MSWIIAWIAFSLSVIISLFDMVYRWVFSGI